MEPKEEYQTVFLMSANSEEEMATNYIVQDNELEMNDQVIVLDDGRSIVIDEHTTFVDEDGNPITVNRTHTGIENGEVVVKIEEESRSPVSMETDSQTEPQERSFEEQEASFKLPESPKESNEQSTEAIDDENTNMEQDLQEETNEQTTEEPGSQKDDVPSDSKQVIAKKRKKRGSDSEEDSAAVKNIIVFEKDSEEPEKQIPEKAIEVPSNAKIDKLTCPHCLKNFSRVCNKLRHIRIVHKVQPINSHGFIRCIECNTKFNSVQKLRDHLQERHRMKMEYQELKFPNMNGFRKWKHEVERKELCLFTLRHGKKKTASGFKYFYACHRAGKYEERAKGVRKRMFRTVGTCKLGIMCTAAIYCEECPDIVNVTYYSHHYGHGKETTFVQLSEVEQIAIQENLSNGVSYANLLGNTEVHTGNDQFQVSLIKRKDMKVIKNAFETEEYNPGLSDAESVDRWVRICCQMEDSPILFYRQEERLGEEEQFLLIVMTEFQKHILLSSDRKILSLDSVHRRKGGRFYLTCLVVLDECEVAFPVAFCISNKVDKDVMRQFLVSVRDATGPLSCTFFMSDSESYFHDMWVDVMDDPESKWVWSMWLVDSKIKVQLRPFKGDVAKRSYYYRTMRKLLECQNVTVFETMFKNYVDELLADPLSRNLANYVQKRYGANKELWAYCYHKEIKLSSIIPFEILHSTFRFCCRIGRKKRLDKFIFVIMKLLRYKMLDRLTSLLDDEKISLAIDAINMCHSIGLEIPTERISSLADKIWLVRSEDEQENEYVVREFDSCPELCALKCSECDICVHMYSCSCMHSMINANLCQHIHAVVWKFLTPHFSPTSSPAHDYEDTEDSYVHSFQSEPRGIFEEVLQRTHDVYKKVRSNKCSMSEASLTAIMKKLDDCMDICSGKIEHPVKSSSTQTAVLSNNLSAFLPQNLTILPQNISRILPQNISRILPQNIATMLPQNSSQYVLVLPNNLNKGARVKK